MSFPAGTQSPIYNPPKPTTGYNLSVNSPSLQQTTDPMARNNGNSSNPYVIGCGCPNGNGLPSSNLFIPIVAILGGVALIYYK